MHSSAGAIKLLVTIDKANSLYGKTTIKRADRTFASAGDITLIHHLRKLLKNDWVRLDHLIRSFILKTFINIRIV